MPTCNSRRNQHRNPIRCSKRTFQTTVSLPNRRAEKTKPAKRKTRVAKPNRPKKPATKIPKPRLTEEEKLERRQRRAKERHQQLKEQGLCRTCGQKAIPGQIRCSKCAEEHRKWNRSYRENRRREQGKQPRPKFDYTETVNSLREENTSQAAAATTKRPKRVRSEAYNKQRREQAAKVRNERKSLGLCVRCAKPSPEGETRCGICAEKHRQECRLAKAKKMLAAEP